MAYNFTENFVLLATATASSSASLSFTAFSSNFATYYVSIRDLLPATNATSLYVTVNAVTTHYTYVYENITSNANATVNSSSASQGILASTLSSTSSRGFSGDYYLYDSQSASNCWMMKGFGCHYNSSGYYNFTEGLLGTTTAVAITTLKFAMASGNIASGSIYLYGVVEP